MNTKLTLHAAARELRRLEVACARRARTRERIANLAALLEGVDPSRREIGVDEVLRELFPGHPDGVTRFRDFRSELHAVAGEHGIRLRCQVDGQKHAAPSERRCWFTGAPEGARRIERLSRDHTAPFPGGVEIPARARRAVRVCVDGTDDALGADLAARVRAVLTVDREFEIDVSDTLALSGESDPQIREARMLRADIVLCLLTASFLHQHQRSEIPADIMVVPVALTDLAGPPTSDFGRPFTLGGHSYRSSRRDDFVHALHKAIVALLVRSGDVGSDMAGKRDRRWGRLLRDPVAGAIESNAVHAPLPATPPTQTVLGKTVDVQSHLAAWADSAVARPYLVIFGEYGMGKTTACNLFTRDLLLRRQSGDGRARLPIYLDLRRLGDTTRRSPTRDTILGDLLVSAWQIDAREGPAVAAEVVDLVRHHGAVAILDGLDEILVHLSQSQRRGFLQELWSILPPGLAAHPETSPNAGRLLLTCRTHFFRTLREQHTYLHDDGHDRSVSGLYDALHLLPFTERQVRAYLEGRVAGVDAEEGAVDRAVALIANVHDLAELVSRPLTLALVADRIEALERRVASGAPIDSAALYEELIDRRLDWDDDKHILRRADKVRLMENLAVELWRRGERALSVERLEQWLYGQLDDDAELGRWFRLSRAELVAVAADLRNATFVVRPGTTDFEFAHTSLLEYFLARRLARALADGDVSAWAIPMPSYETLDFLGQIISAGDTQACLRGLRQLRDTYHAHASEAALAYCIRSLDRRRPGLPLSGFALEGAHLRGLAIVGRSDRTPWRLSHCALAGADLRGALFRHVRLEHCDLTGANLAQAELHDSEVDHVLLDDADVTGLIVRRCRVSAVDLSAARASGTQWLRCSFHGVTWPTAGEDHLVAPPQTGVGPAPPPRRTEAFLTSFAGHTGGVWGVSFSPDGARVASAGADGTIRVWDAERGDQLLNLDNHRAGVWAAAFSPDGRSVASADDDGAVRLWDAHSGEPLRNLDGHQGGARALAYSPDGSRLATAGYDGTVRVCDPETGEVLFSVEGHDGGVGGVAYSPDGSRVGSAGADGTVRLWDATNGDQTLCLEAHAGAAQAVAYSPDGERLATCGADGAVILWDATSGALLLRLLGHKGDVWRVAFSPDGLQVATAGDDGTLRVWDAALGESLLRVDGHSGGVRDVAFSLDGTRLASGGADGTVRVWNANAGDPIRRLDGHSGGMWSVSFSPDGGTVVSAGADGRARVWDALTGTHLASLDGHVGGIWTTAYAPSGSRVITGGEDGTLRSWGVDSGKPEMEVAGHRGGVRSVRFAAGSAQIASAGSDGAVRVWDGVNGRELGQLIGHEGGVRDVAFAPDAATVVSVGADGTVRVWNVERGAQLLCCEGHDGGVRSVAYASDGRRLASAGDDGTVRTWNPRNGQQDLCIIGHRGGVRCVTYAPDGAQLASAGADGTVRLWDARSGRELQRLEGHRGGVRSVAYSPDGECLASAGADGTVRIWEVADGKARLVIYLFDDGEHAAQAQHGLTACSEGAWRWLGWIAPSPTTGRMTRYPAEMFGPLPVGSPPAQVPLGGA